MFERYKMKKALVAKLNSMDDKSTDEYRRLYTLYKDLCDGNRETVKTAITAVATVLVAGVTATATVAVAKQNSRASIKVAQLNNAAKAANLDKVLHYEEQNILDGVAKRDIATQSLR